MNDFFLVLFILLFFQIKSFNFYLSMFVEEADDCISQIYYINTDNIKFQQDCTNTSNWKKAYINPIVNKINYEFGNPIYIDVLDNGGVGCLKINVRLNEYLIKPEHSQFWTCTNCEGEDTNYIYNSTLDRFDFYNPEGRTETLKTFNFVFKIDNRNNLKGIIDKNYYTIKQTREEYIYLNNLDEEIELINFQNKDNFYITYNKNEDIQFDTIYFRIFHDQRFLMNGEILGYDFWENQYKILPHDGDFFKIINEYPSLKYRLTEKEKNMNGAFIKIYIQTYNAPDQESLREEVSQLTLFNYYICLNDYKPCDIDSSFKCLKNEGFFSYNDNGNPRYFSCYERCGNCDTYKRTPFATNENHFCDECHSKYPLYINMTNYKNCYEECPFPYYKNPTSNECLKCANYITNDLNCVDKCISTSYKYENKQEKICYNIIPDNYFIYIEDYNIKYDDNPNSPVVNIGKDCPNNSYTKYNYFCLTSITDIYSLISPLYFNQYKNPIKIDLTDKTVYIRIYSSDTTYDELIKKYPDYFNIDISQCEPILKEYYHINNDNNLLVYDINDLQNNEYEYKIYSLEGTELDINICLAQGVSLCSAGYYNNENNECVECPEQCLYCSKESIQNNLCIKCNNKNNYYMKYIESNGDIYFTCINEMNKPENYHLNIDNLRYEPCYKTCDQCSNYGNEKNNNCINCKNGYITKEEYPNNCVEECPFYYYYNQLQQYICTTKEDALKITVF